MTEDDPTIDLLGKKKKKKKKTPFDLDGALEGGVNKDEENKDEEKEKEDDEEQTEKKGKKVEFEDDQNDIDGIDLESFGKKKKKKKKRGDFDMEDLKETLPGDDENKENNDESEAIDDDLDLGSFGLKKKKSKKGKRKDLEDVLQEEEDEKENDPESMDSRTPVPSEPLGTTYSYENSDRDYSYDELLQRVFNIMRDKNPEMVAGEKKKFVMRPPQVVRVGTKKTAFANFTEIAKMLHRQPKHLLAFLFAELGTSGAIDGSNQLIMKGRFQQKHIENVLRRYIKEYVTCHTCRSPDTILNKETRLFFLHCMTCNSSCSVQTIKTGFQAVTGKRSAIRAKQ